MEKQGMAGNSREEQGIAGSEFPMFNSQYPIFKYHLALPGIQSLLRRHSRGSGNPESGMKVSWIPDKRSKLRHYI